MPIICAKTKRTRSSSLDPRGPLMVKGAPLKRERVPSQLSALAIWCGTAPPPTRACGVDQRCKVSARQHTGQYWHTTQAGVVVGNACVACRPSAGPRQRHDTCWWGCAPSLLTAQSKSSDTHSPCSTMARGNNALRALLPQCRRDCARTLVQVGTHLPVCPTVGRCPQQGGANPVLVWEM